jgi:hypothetical protein
MKRWLIIIGAIFAISVVALIATLPAAKRHAESLNCRSQMYGILCAATLWSADNGGRLPSDFLAMTNELSTPRILVCPRDHIHPLATSWASFTTNNSSFEIVAPGIYKTDTNVVYLRCKIHGYVGYSDGRVLDASGRVLVRSRL